MDNQEATKAEISGKLITLFYGGFFEWRKIGLKKIRTRSAALCTVFAQKAAWAHFIYDPRFNDK